MMIFKSSETLCEDDADAADLIVDRQQMIEDITTDKAGLGLLGTQMKIIARITLVLLLSLSMADAKQR
jgi:hypothetical protein